jgi:glycosyltransferase involved in cell wall biosynthesis
VTPLTPQTPHGLTIAVLGEFPLGSHFAHAINVVKTSGGMARAGHKTTLLCRAGNFRDTPANADDAKRAALASYSEPALAVELCPHPECPDDPDSASWTFARWAAARAKDMNADVVYARHFHGAIACAELGLTTILETHSHVGDARPILDECFAATRRRVGQEPDLQGIASIITIHTSLRTHYIARGADSRRVHLVADGVDVELFARPASVPPSIISGQGPHAVYAGSLSNAKGIPTILSCAVGRPHVTFHLIGGSREERERIESMRRTLGLTNVRIHGRLEHAHVPPALWNADVLLLPPSAKDPSAQWTSPVKLGEYLAAQRPIIASRIPGLTAWVNDSVVHWFEPDDPCDLGRAIDDALSANESQRCARDAASLAAAHHFSYPNRAARILATLAAAEPSLASAASPEHSPETPARARRTHRSRRSA